MGYWYGDRCHEDYLSIIGEIIGKVHGSPTMCNGLPAVWTTEFGEETGIAAWPLGPGCTGPAAETTFIRPPFPLLECEPYDFTLLGITPAEVASVAAWGFGAIVTGWALGLVAGWAAEAIRKA